MHSQNGNAPVVAGTTNGRETTDIRYEHGTTTPEPCQWSEPTITPLTRHQTASMLDNVASILAQFPEHRVAESLLYLLEAVHNQYQPKSFTDDPLGIVTTHLQHWDVTGQW